MPFVCVCVFLGMVCCYQSGEDAQYLTCWQHRIQVSELRAVILPFSPGGGQNIYPRNGLKKPLQQASCSKCQGLFLANIYLTPKDSVGALNPQRDSARTSTWEAGLYLVLCESRGGSQRACFLRQRAQDLVSRLPWLTCAPIAVM